MSSRRQLLQSSATSSGPTSPFSGCARSPTIRTRGSTASYRSKTQRQNTSLKDTAPKHVAQRHSAKTRRSKTQRQNTSLKDTAQQHVAQRHSAKTRRSKTQRKNTASNTSFRTPQHATQTQTTPQIQSTPAFPKWCSLIIKWAPIPILAPQKSKLCSPGSIFQRPANGRKHCLKMSEAHCKKRKHFCKCTFPQARSKFAKPRALNNMHFGSIHWVFCMFFVFTRFHFLSPQREPNHEKKAHLGGPFLELGTQKSERAHSDQKSGSQRRPVPSFGFRPKA